MILLDEQLCDPAILDELQNLRGSIRLLREFVPAQLDPMVRSRLVDRSGRGLDVTRVDVRTHCADRPSSGGTRSDEVSVAAGDRVCRAAGNGAGGGRLLLDHRGS